MRGGGGSGYTRHAHLLCPCRPFLGWLSESPRVPFLSHQLLFLPSPPQPRCQVTTVGRPGSLYRVRLWRAFSSPLCNVSLPRGFDIANHFCEWMYNYAHDEWPFYKATPRDFPTRHQQVTGQPPRRCKSGGGGPAGEGPFSLGRDRGCSGSAGRAGLGRTWENWDEGLWTTTSRILHPGITAVVRRSNFSQTSLLGFCDSGTAGAWPD